MNEIGEQPNNLAYIDHKDLLECIVRRVRETNPFEIVQQTEPWRDYLHVKAHNIAATIAQKDASTLADPVQPGSSPASCSTVNYKPDTEKDVIARIKEIQGHLDRHLREVAQQQGMTVGKYVAHLLTDRASLLDPKGQRLGFSYPLDRRADLTRQRLTFTVPPVGRPVPLLRSHHATIIVSVPDDFTAQVRDSLRRHIDQQWPDEGIDRDEMIDVLDRMVADTGSDLYRLIGVMMEQTVGQLGRTACTSYLAALADHLGEKDEGGDDLSERTTARRYLQDYVRRLDAIQAFAHDPDLTDDDYTVSYRDETFNLQAILSGADVFKDLPLIALLEGHIGETYDDRRGEQSYRFGLKLKLNGPVSMANKDSVFSYFLDLLTHYETLAAGRTGKREKLLRLLILYHVVFNRLGEFPDDPLDSFKERILPTLKEGTREEKDNLFAALAGRL